LAPEPASPPSRKFETGGQPASTQLWVSQAMLSRRFTPETPADRTGALDPPLQLPAACPASMLARLRRQAVPIRLRPNRCRLAALRSALCRSNPPERSDTRRCLAHPALPVQIVSQLPWARRSIPFPRGLRGPLHRQEARPSRPLRPAMTSSPSMAHARAAPARLNLPRRSALPRPVRAGSDSGGSLR